MANAAEGIRWRGKLVAQSHWILGKGSFKETGKRYCQIRAGRRVKGR